MDSDRIPFVPQQWYLERIGLIARKENTYSAIEPIKDAKLRTQLRNVRVAVMDDGVDLLHDDFGGISRLNENTILSFGDGAPNDNPQKWDTHGTNCAGIIAGIFSNKEGISGVAGEVKISNYRIMYRLFPSAEPTVGFYLDSRGRTESGRRWS